MRFFVKVILAASFVVYCTAPAVEKEENEKKESIATSTPTCPTCDVEFCPKSAQECTHGLVRDDCGCCEAGVCLLREREKCLNLKLHKNITETHMTKLSVCGEYSECVLRTDLKAGEISESVCTCQKMQVSCGKDNTTYLSMCQLREANTELKHSGPCKRAPEIVLETEVVSTMEDERFSLDCEAKGYPVPLIHWEFEGLDGLFKTLPGDDPAVVVHNRGGPEPLTVSSWVMIDSLRVSDGGSYICVAKNSEGVARTAASVYVSKKNSN